VNDKPVLLKGTLFTALFKVDSPAKQPPQGPSPPVPDPLKEYTGQGMFNTTNRKFKGV
jgi:hypothetical protein